MFFVSISIFQGMKSSMKGFVSSGDTDASGNHTLYFQGCQQSLSNEFIRSNLPALDAAIRIVLISITYQSNRAGSITLLVRR